ncbi:MAG: ABC transporter permease [Bauldia sp.]|nr:ABC transporter permease [Bauldia sp.]
MTMVANPERGGASGGGTQFVRRYGVLLALIVLILVLAIASPSFLEPRNIFNILSQWTPVGIMAIGATFVILAGGFDLSAASGFALCAVVAALIASSGIGVEVAFLAALCVGLVIGAANALLVVVLRINPFVATLASGFVLAGVPFTLVKNPYIMVFEDGFDAIGTGSISGVPYSVLILAALFIIGGIVLSRTPFGEWVYGVGGNPEAARLFGIPVGWVTAITYVISGFSMGAAAVISTSQLSYSASDQDPALIFNVIVAVVVGGTSLAGGYGAMWRTAVGLAILAAVQNGLNLMQVNSAAQYIVKGLIIVGALGFDVWTRSLSGASRANGPVAATAARPSRATAGKGGAS